MARRTLYKAGSASVLLLVVVCYHQAFNKTASSAISMDTLSGTSRRGRFAENTYHQQYFKHSDVQTPGHLGRTLLASDAECREIHQADDKCRFFTETADCHLDGGFFDYARFTYCILGSAVPLAIVILVFWWLFCFVGLAVCADDFFCPSLVVISKTLRLSPNVAGVTFLAFGNGAPDFFSAISALGKTGPNSDAGLGVGGLFGAGMFVTTVVVGTVGVLKPFKAMERPFLRDVIFYMGAVFWTFSILWREKMYLLETVGFIMTYIVYVTVVIVSGIIYKRLKNAEENKQNNGVSLQGVTALSPTEGVSMISGNINLAFEGDTPATARPGVGLQGVAALPPAAGLSTISGNTNLTFEGNTAATAGQVPGIAPMIRQPSMASIGCEEPQSQTLRQDSVNSAGSLLALLPNGDTREVNGGVPDATMDAKFEDGTLLPWWQQFLYSINPINIDDWPEMRWYARVYEIFKAPILFAIKLFCPVVDYEEPELNKWSRYLNSLQCVISPPMCAILIGAVDAKIGDVFPVWALLLILGTLVAVPVFLVTKDDVKPRFHWAFGYMGFLVALVWIYTIANEIVNLLETFGVVFDISSAILGLTLLAWGNSIGDWVANSVMARQGFPRMAFAACFGAPLFNLTLGFSIPMLSQMIQTGNDSVKLQLTPIQLVLSFFLLGSLVSSLILIPLLKFKVSRPMGLYLLIYYLIFLVVALLTETEVILKDIGR